MISFFYRAFYSKNRLKHKFLAPVKDITLLAISVNEVPNYGLFSSKFTFTDTKKRFGVEYQTSNKEVKFQISCDQVAKSYFDQRFQGRDVIERIEKKKILVIDNVIKKMISRLENVSPVLNPGEEKVLEWLRVSLTVLKEAISKIDGVETILQYKIFFQGESLRIIAYNIDIELKIVDDFVIFKAFNYKNNKEQNSEPIYNVQLKSSYNDFLNNFIGLLKVIREKERELLF